MDKEKTIKDPKMEQVKPVETNTRPIQYTVGKNPKIEKKSVADMAKRGLES